MRSVRPDQRVPKRGEEILESMAERLPAGGGAEEPRIVEESE